MNPRGGRSPRLHHPGASTSPRTTGGRGYWTLKFSVVRHGAEVGGRSGKVAEVLTPSCAGVRATHAFPEGAGVWAWLGKEQPCPQDRTPGSSSALGPVCRGDDALTLTYAPPQPSRPAFPLDERRAQVPGITCQPWLPAWLWPAGTSRCQMWTFAGSAPRK